MRRIMKDKEIIEAFEEEVKFAREHRDGHYYTMMESEIIEDALELIKRQYINLNKCGKLAKNKFHYDFIE